MALIWWCPRGALPLLMFFLLLTSTRIILEQWLLRLNILYVFKMQWFSLLDSNGQKKGRCAQSRECICMETTWECAVSWTRCLVPSLSLSCSFVDADTCYKCEHRLLLNLKFQCAVVFAEATLLSQVVASAEVTVSKMLSRNTYWSWITLRERSQTCRGSGCCPDAVDESALYRDKFTIIDKYINKQDGGGWVS